MKYMNVIFLLFMSNLIVAMEIEPKKSTWRVDREIQFNTEKKNVPKMIRYKDSLRSVCFDPTGTKIIAFPWHADCFACMWDRDGKKLENLDFDAYDQFSENNSEWSDRFLSSGNSYSFPVYEGNDVELLQKEFDCWYPTVCCNEQQTYIVPQFRVYGGHNVYVWNPVEQKRLFSLKHTGTIYSVDFNPQGIEIITASADGTVRLWNKKDGKELLCIKYPTRVMSASFNSTGTEMIVATDDGKIQILVKEISQ